jgi:hypothetical protein
MIRSHGLQAKRVFAGGYEVQGDRMTTPAAVHVLCFKPRAQARVEDFRLALPEIWRQPALNSEMIQLQFDRGDFPGKIPADIVRADEQSRESPAFTLSFDYHVAPALQREM